MTRSVANADVFVSAAETDAAVAEAVVEMLESKGIDCWMAPRDAPVCIGYRQHVREAISASKAVLLVLSKNTDAALNIKHELAMLAENPRPIFLLNIDGSTHPKGLADFHDPILSIDVDRPPFHDISWFPAAAAGIRAAISAEPEFDVYISYATQDLAWVMNFSGVIAEQAMAMQARSPRVWHIRVDGSDVQAYSRMVVALQQAKVFVMVLSPEYFEQDFCRLELNASRDVPGFQAAKDRPKTCRLAVHRRPFSGFRPAPEGFDGVPRELFGEDPDLLRAFARSVIQLVSERRAEALARALRSPSPANVQGD